MRRLCWEQVDLPGAQVRILKTKTCRARAVPLVGGPLALLEGVARHRCQEVPWVFPSWREKEPVAIGSAWETARHHCQYICAGWAKGASVGTVSDFVRDFG